MTSPVGVQIQGPLAQKYLYGLQSAAQVIDAADQKEFWAGVTWDTDCPPAPMASTAAAMCDPHTGKTLPEGVVVAEATPFRGYGGLFCKLPGRGDLMQRAAVVFDLIEWPYIESAAWSGAPGNVPALSDLTSADLTPIPGTAIALEQATGILDQFLAEQYATLGTIWSPRLLAGYWAIKSQMTQEGPRKVDPMGNPIVFAAYTGNLGPTGVAPAAGTYWLYATGPVMVRRSTVFTPRLQEAFNRTENEVFAIVERQYLVTWGCDAGAVLVNPALPPQA